MSAPDSTVDYYEALEVAPSASPEVVEAAYRGLMKKYGSDPDPAVRERRRSVEQAYEVLSHRDRRAAYDDARRGSPWPGISLHQCDWAGQPLWPAPGTRTPRQRSAAAAARRRSARSA